MRSDEITRTMHVVEMDKKKDWTLGHCNIKKSGREAKNQPSWPKRSNHWGRRKASGVISWKPDEERWRKWSALLDATDKKITKKLTVGFNREAICDGYRSSVSGVKETEPDGWKTCLREWEKNRKQQVQTFLSRILLQRGAETWDSNWWWWRGLTVVDIQLHGWM